jgi:hypothetical protein
LLAQHRVDEADTLLSGQMPDTGPPLPAWQVRWRIVRSRVLLARDDASGALACAQEAVAIAEVTDDLVLRGDAYTVLGRALTACRRQKPAAVTLQMAVELYARKQASAPATRLASVAPLSFGARSE